MDLTILLMASTAAAVCIGRSSMGSATGYINNYYQTEEAAPDSESESDDEGSSAFNLIN